MIGYLVLGICIGILIGMSLISIVSISRINEAESLVWSSRKSLANAENMIEEQAKQIEKLRKALEYKAKHMKEEIDNHIPHID